MTFCHSWKWLRFWEQFWIFVPNALTVVHTSIHNILEYWITIPNIVISISGAAGSNRITKMEVNIFSTQAWFDQNFLSLLLTPLQDDIKMKYVRAGSLLSRLFENKSKTTIHCSETQMNSWWCFHKGGIEKLCQIDLSLEMSHSCRRMLIDTNGQREGLIRAQPVSC